MEQLCKQYTKKIINNEHIEIKFTQPKISLNNAFKKMVITKDYISFGDKSVHKVYLDEITDFKVEHESLIAMMKNRRVLIAVKNGSLLLDEIKAVLNT